MRRALPSILVLGSVAVFLGASGAYAQFDLSPPSPFDPGFGLPPSVQNTLAVGRLLIIGLAGLLGLFLGFLFSPAARGLRLLLLLIGIGGGCWFIATSPSPWADILTAPVAWVTFIFAVGLGFRLGWIKPKFLRRGDAPPPTSFGTAKWADAQHLANNDMLQGTGFTLGRYEDDRVDEPLIYNGDRHLLTVAPTRSGKGVTAIIPNLLTYQGSALVIDPKGENAMVTAKRRGAGDPRAKIRGLGQKVFIVDPWSIAAPQVGLVPARLNPLDWIKPDDPDLSENAFLLADAFIPSESQGEDRFWDEEAKALLMGIMLYVATAPAEAATRHLGRVRDIITLGGKAFDAVLEQMFAHPNPIVSSTATRTAGKEPKLRANVMASVQAHTHFLDSPRIRESLAASDFSFADLKSSAMTVYLVLPADRLKTFDRWLRILVQQAISINARSIETKPKKPILFMLDEMAALGRLAMVEQAYGLMAGFGMQLWGIVQDLSQLNRIYGDGWETFISNSGVLQYFGSRDRMTAEYFSTLCGVTTIRIFSFSAAVGDSLGESLGWSSSTGDKGITTTTQSSGRNWSQSLTRTASTNESQRKLAYPDELMVMPANRQIVLVENLNPIAATKVKWFEDEALKPLGVDLHHPDRLLLTEEALSEELAQSIMAALPMRAKTRPRGLFEKLPDIKTARRSARAFVRAYPMQTAAALTAYLSVPVFIGLVPWLALSFIAAVAALLYIDRRTG